MDYVIASVENMKEAIKVRSTLVANMDAHAPRKVQVLLKRRCYVGHSLHSPFCGFPERKTSR